MVALSDGSGLGVVESVKRALTWLVVFAVGLAPMLVY
jgi:hypothetical protein